LDACASYSTLEHLNHELRPALDDLTKNTDFFSYYRLNLFNKQCPFWNDDHGMCGNIACAVNTIDDEKDIPLVWRAEELSKLEGPKAGHPGKKQQKERPAGRPLQGMLGENVSDSCVLEVDDECDDRDYCVPEDESATGKGDYVSLVENPERFTGYIGPGANQVWEAIYRENCFSKASFPKSASLGTNQIFGSAQPAANDLKWVLQGGPKNQPNIVNAPSAETGFENEDECLEKRVFYRVVSGMHASISAHLCWDSLNQSTGQWGPNLDCYIWRLHKHPERIANLYFNYALLTRAVAKLNDYIKSYTYCTGDPVQDLETKQKVQEVTEKAAATPQIFDESIMFVNGEGPSLKEDFRNRFRNVSRLMDCVGCDKCRLWGKLQTAGYGAALKVLFEFDNKKTGVKNPQLRRTELVALFNTFARLSSSISSVEAFREMVREKEALEGTKHEGEFYHKISDRERLPRHQITDPRKDRKDTYDEKLNEKETRERSAENEHTVVNEIWAELGTIWKVVKFVMASWVRVPVMA
jgi:ERO1-like protein beta